MQPDPTVQADESRIQLLSLHFKEKVKQKKKGKRKEKHTRKYVLVFQQKLLKMCLKCSLKHLFSKNRTHWKEHHQLIASLA